MDRFTHRRFRRLSFAVLLAAGVFLSGIPGCGIADSGGAIAASVESQPTTPTPVLLTSTPLPDPGVFHFNSRYTVFGTAKRCFQTRTFQPDDLTWFDLDLDCGSESDKIFDVWAFRVYRHTDGTFHGYGALHYPWFRTVIAHFVPKPGEEWTDDRPILRWQLDRPLVGDIESEHFTYDPEMVLDDDGTLYLVYSRRVKKKGSPDSIQILIQKMKSPGSIDPEFSPRVLLRPEGLNSEDRDPGGFQLVEGATIRKINGMWTLLYSVGDFGAKNYKLGIAYSKTLIPPGGKQYQKVRRVDSKNLWGNGIGTKEIVYLVQSEHREWPNFAGDTVIGPGIGTLVDTPGGPLLVFHGWKPVKQRKKGDRRHVWTLPVEVHVGTHRPREEWVQPRRRDP